MSSQHEARLKAKADLLLMLSLDSEDTKLEKLVEVVTDGFSGPRLRALVELIQFARDRHQSRVIGPLVWDGRIGGD